MTVVITSVLLRGEVKEAKAGHYRLEKNIIAARERGSSL